ncbi:hypothetical protein CBR_g24137 [Chara braunii]|uniref:Integrase catalytic domain-containing protein n=1 Tax=Chara braunii TaxID=69332 RepID=A0A388L5V3_CHABU|nr:hypothetical protein CBR_g24137 [Chara braunii]|eukprot:GBG77691.1 hypothetical protein CBR_g24137 [Chara braunii]
MEIARYVNRFLGMHQDTEQILTDNGAEFRGGVLKNLVIHGVAIRNTAPHMSQCNGLVENANRVIKTTLRRNIAARDLRPWADIVDHILAVHRGTPHESTGLSPFQLRTNSVACVSIPSLPDESTLNRGPTRATARDKAKRHLELMERSLPRLARKRQKMTELAQGRQVRSYEARNGNVGPRPQYKLGDVVQWSAYVEGAAERIPLSQQQYLDPRTIRDPAFFKHPTAEQFAAIREEEEEEESTRSDEDEDVREEDGDSDEELGEEDETPEEGSCSEHSEGEPSEEEEEDEEGEEEHEEEPAESEWEAVPEEALRTGTEAEDLEAARKREEIVVGKELELVSEASLQIHDDPNRDPEPPRPEDGDLAATTPTPSTRRWSRFPSSPTRPPVRRRTDTGGRRKDAGRSSPRVAQEGDAGRSNRKSWAQSNWRPPKWKIPKPKLVVRASSFRHPNSRHVEYISGHAFNNAIEIFVPCLPTSQSLGPPLEELSSICGDDNFIYVIKAPISLFINPQFSASYIKNTEGGSVCALSSCSLIDQSDTVALAPDGKLYLGVTKDTYQRLGLPGKLSNFVGNERYNICIDLRAPSFVPGGTFYDKVNEAFLTRTGVMEFVCTFFSGGRSREMCFPTSVASRRVTIDKSYRIMKMVPLPPLDGSATQSAEVDSARSTGTPQQTSAGLAGQAKGGKRRQQRDNLEKGRTGINNGQEEMSGDAMEVDEGYLCHVSIKCEESNKGDNFAAELNENPGHGPWLCPLDAEFLSAVHEWVGAISCGAAGGIIRASTSDGDEYVNAVSSYKWPIPHRGQATRGDGNTTRWTGMFTPAQVAAFLERARSFVRSGRAPWCAFSVWGFADSPVSWDGAEHGYLLGGENDYTFLLFPNDKYIRFSAAGGYDALR